MKSKRRREDIIEINNQSSCSDHHSSSEPHSVVDPLTTDGLSPPETAPLFPVSTVTCNDRSPQTGGVPNWDGFAFLPPEPPERCGRCVPMLFPDARSARTVDRRWKESLFDV